MERKGPYSDPALTSPAPTPEVSRGTLVMMSQSVNLPTTESLVPTYHLKMFLFPAFALEKLSKRSGSWRETAEANRKEGGVKLDVLKTCRNR